MQVPRLFIFTAAQVPAVILLMAISPQFTDLTAGDKQVRFFANSDDPVSQLIVGTVSSQTDPGSFVSLDTITFPTPDTYQEVIIPITTANGYNGTHEHVVLAHNMAATFDYIRVDEFVYEDIPPCSKIITNQVNLSVGTTSTTVNIPGATMDIEWGPCGFTQGTGTFHQGVSSPFTLTGMSPATCYDIYIRRNCLSGGNGTSTWSGPFSIQTSCLPTGLPFTENFDVWPLTCWDTTGGSEYWTEFTGPSGDNYAFANFWNISDRKLSPNHCSYYHRSASTGEFLLVALG
ncbi:MAG: hypothetical protein U5L96_03245 [Owenweeksia sp.]|nr:hypothetical protein [Owenweeksia sp.]